MEVCVSRFARLFDIYNKLFFAAKLLLTPFRSQNVPPPMSSFQLPLSPDIPSQVHTPTKIPIYVTFCPTNDAMAILWEHGLVELWDLRTRLLPGPGKIMDPSKIWSGSISDKPDLLWRQSAVAYNGSYIITTLGTGSGAQKDLVSVITISDRNVVSKTTTSLPYRNCRLLLGAVPNTYQGPDGEIFNCESAKSISKASLMI